MIAAYHQALERPCNIINVVVYGGFVITMMDQAFHVAAGSDLVQVLNVNVQRSTEFINIDHLLGSQKDLL